ncbi:hypothetical protein ABW19_dt0208593 [Dactylella cylindrospora]|nr:hypothetical protein ABW19_dt0208593 [Dactylella cylindrospora]
MFRAAPANPFDDVVAKATDENLTSENWEYIMEAVDKVLGGGENAAKDIIAALIKRLAHRNAQVQIYTLENCGTAVYQELSSRAFTDTLLRLAGDRNTHQAVKTKILERMEEWVEMFSKNPNLGIMEQAYIRLKSQNPSLQAPSKPTKSAITDADRLKEEEDLARALEMSLQDTRRQNYPAASSSSTAAGKQPETKPEQPPVNNTAATVSRVRALYDFVPTESGELAFRKGDIILVIESVYKDWWKGSLRGQTGIFPLNYVEKLADPTVEELQREAQTEAEVFAQIKNVEKLLSMLSTSSADQQIQDNEEITALYHQTLAIRPKLIDLISKYQQKRDDFQALNEKFVKARRDYESLLDSSMSNPAVNAYPRPPYNYGGPGVEYAGGPAPGPQGLQGPQGMQGPQGLQGPQGPGGYYPQQSQHHSPPPPINTSGPYGPPDVQPGPYGPPDVQQPGRAYGPTTAAPIPPAGTNPANFYAAQQPGPMGPEGRKPSSPQSQLPPVRDRIPSSGGFGDAQPQELATSAYESPQDPSGRPLSPNHPQQSAYKSYYTYNPPTGGPQQPGPAGGPIGQSQQPGGYPPYLNNAPPGWGDQNAGGPPNPADYYRNSELFLPQGGGPRAREA